MVVSKSKRKSSKKFKRNRSAFDLFTIGHIIFGLNLTAYLTLISLLFFPGREILLLIGISIIPIILWEILENGLLAKINKKWAEKPINIISDIIIGFIMFLISFYFIYVIIYELYFTLIYLYFTTVLIIIFLLIVMKKRSKKKR